MKESLTILSGLLTPLLAVVATYIAYQQWHTNQIKLQHDLYERRLAVFTTLMEFLSLTLLQGTKTEGLGMGTFHNKTRESCFLFGKEIPDYLDEVYNKAFRLYAMNLKFSPDNPPTGEELNRLMDEKDQLREWIIAELKTGARDRFAKYLKLY